MRFKLTLIVIWVICFTTLNAQDIFIQRGKASFYADKFDGRTTASGEKYKHSKPTAAHLTLPFGTKVKVTNLANDLSVVVTINDRGPYVQGRIIDLSKSAAKKLEFISQGLADVSIQVVDYESDIKGTAQAGRPDMKDLALVEKNEYYKLEARRVDPHGYGVQIGSYMELVNLMRVSESLKSSYQKQVTVEVSILNKVKVYKIIVGNLSNRSKAEDLKRRLQKEYPDSFIIGFKE